MSYVVNQTRSSWKDKHWALRFLVNPDDYEYAQILSMSISPTFTNSYNENPDLLINLNRIDRISVIKTVTIKIKQIWWYHS